MTTSGVDPGRRRGTIRNEPYEGESCHPAVNPPRLPGLPDLAGIVFGRLMADRVVVFVDHQNVYRGARRTFHQVGDSFWYGQIDPVLLGTHLAADSPCDRLLGQVRIYRGAPTGARDVRGFAASERQHERWRRSPLVDLTIRSVRYPPGWPDLRRPGDTPQEKGIDVALAIDFAVMAVRREFDVGILTSTDTDLLPALEFVAGPPPARTKSALETRHAAELTVAGVAESGDDEGPLVEPFVDRGGHEAHR
jgi:NYN domain